MRGLGLAFHSSRCVVVGSYPFEPIRIDGQRCPFHYLPKHRMAKSPGKILRSAVAKATLQIPGAPNALMGKLIERVGFAATYLSGGAFSAGTMALPDVGLFTLTELVEETRRLAQAVKIPVIVDADTGFGAALNVERTVQDLEHAGAAAIQLEDQQFPKRCGHLAGKRLVDSKEMVAKIRAAVAARSDSSLVIIARTDARGVDGLDAALARAEQYLEAGADWIFPEALSSHDEFATFSNRIEAPLMANMTEFGKSPLLSHAELSDLRFAAIIYPVTLLRAAMKTAEQVLTVIAEEGSQQALLGAMQSRAELYDLLGYEDYGQRDEAYFGKEPNE